MEKIKLESSRKVTLGTKEWADSNVNCYSGCSNDCRYCYAKKMAIRFKRKTNDNWKVMELNQKVIEKGYLKRKGRIMFPSSHDITQNSIKACLIVLEKILKAGNNVLITSKPNPSCIKKICTDLAKYNHQIQFRFTITSYDNDSLRFWEPGAPLYEERLSSLKYAFKSRFKTSISIEPFLDADPYILVDQLIPFVSESIWIGKMNYISKQGASLDEKRHYEKIKRITIKENLSLIVKKSRSYDNEIIRIKDSVYNYLSIDG
jgi:DNA repair photolyase